MSAPTENAIATLPSNSLTLRSPKGKAVGERYFMGSLSAKDLRATGKEMGYKGAALTEYVNKALRDEEANRAAVVAATVSALASKGFVADTVDVRKASATIKFIKPAPAPVAPAPAKPAPSLAEQLVAKGKFATLAEAEAFLA